MSNVPPVLETSAPPPLPNFKDRRTGLVVFGILEILMGVLCVLMAGFVILGQAMIARTSGAAMDTQTLIPAILSYVALATTFVWLGIGSIKCRRWARALILILAWCWLFTGVVSVPLTGVVLPRAMAAAAPNGQALPPGVVITMVIFQLLFMTVMFVVLPAVLVFFHRSPHVKATCEARDPVRRWTDACPLPVLGVSCVLWLGSVMMASLPLAGRGTMPFFGTLLSGWTGSLVALSMAGLWIWIGFAWYRLKVSGWWALLAAVILLCLSSFITFSRVDISEMYQKMGYSQAQIDLIRQHNIISSSLMTWSSMFMLVLMVVYLVWAKRFFQPRPRTQ